MNHLAAGGVVGARHLTLVVSAVPGTRVSDKAVSKPSQISECLEKTSIRTFSLIQALSQLEV